jgi:hypothetical protein
MGYTLMPVPPASFTRDGRFITKAILLVVTAIAVSGGNSQQIRSITLRPHTAIAEVEFTAITSVRELSDGSLLVADRSEARVVLIRWRPGGEVVVGRNGDGPGEYRGVGWVYPLGNDTTLLTDWTNGRWHILDGARIVQTIGTQPLNRLLNPQLSGTDKHGNVLGVQGQKIGGITTSVLATADSLLFVLADRGGNRFVTVATGKGLGGRMTVLARPSGGQAGRVVGNNPLAVRDQALLFPDGWIAVARAESYRVDWRSPSGRWTQTVSIPFTRVALDEREKCAALERWFGNKQPCNPSEVPGWPETMPAFLAGPTPTLLAMPDGNLMVSRARTARLNRNDYDLIDRQGRLVGKLALPANESVIGFGLGSIYVVATDELGLQRIRRHPWP